VHARSAAVRMFNGLCRAEGWPDFARVAARTGAGDGYGNISVSGKKPLKPVSPDL
jgi:hypothetical protein